MNAFDVALDEYLHLVARVCPWDLPREEPLLTAFAEWVSVWGHGEAHLESLGPESAERFAEQADLSQQQYETLLAALAGLYRWAIRDGRVYDNPFVGAYELSRAARKSLLSGAMPA